MTTMQADRFENMSEEETNEMIDRVIDQQSCPRPATRADLIAGINRLVEVGNELSKQASFGRWIPDDWNEAISDINKLLESEG